MGGGDPDLLICGKHYQLTCEFPAEVYIPDWHCSPDFVAVWGQA